MTDMINAESRFTDNLWLRLTGFVFIPVAFNALLFLLYFGPWGWGRALIVPDMSPLPQDSWREFGLLELLQDAYLLVIVVAATAFLFRAQRTATRVFGGIVAAGALLVLLEEVNFGQFLYQWLSGDITEPSALAPHEQLNFHNSSPATLKTSKLVFNLGMVTWFAVVPLATLVHRQRHPLVNWARPTCWYLLAGAVIVVARTVAHGLDDAGYGAGLQSNISEFAEHNAYYLGMLYALDVFFRRRAPAAPAHGRAVAAAPVEPQRAFRDSARTATH